MAQNYSELIRQVIADFDEIYSVLKNKKAEYNSAVLPTPAEGVTGIATNLYGNIINSNLVKVDGLSVSQLSLTNGMLDNNTGNLTTGKTVIDYSNKAVVISEMKPGYYSAASTLTLSGASVTGGFVEATINQFTLNANNYVLTPTTGIISKVTIAKGKVEGSASAVASTEEGKAPSATVTSTLTDTGTILKASGAAADAYVVTLKETPVLAGDVKASVSTDSVTPGYIADENDVILTGGTYSLENVSVSEATKTYYIEHGKVNIDVSNSNITPSVNINGLATGSAEKGYAITASVTDVTLTPEITEGYVKEGDVTLDATKLTNADTTVYIAHGDVVGAANNPNANINLTSSIAEADDFAGDAYTVNAVTDTLTLKHTVNEGYVKAQDVADIVVAQANKSIKIAHGTANAAVQANAISSTDGKLSAAETKYGFDVTSAVTLRKTLTQGYVKDADFTVTNSSETNRFYIKEGIVGTPTNVLSVTPNFTDSENKVTNQIFKTVAPAKGDYYTVLASSNLELTEGYIDSQTVTKSSNAYYVPKATFEFVKSETDNVANFIQVTTGGYIPSGQIVELGGELGEADYAAVTVGISDANGIANDSLTDHYYEISLVKGAVNAGYISDTNGTVSGSIKIAHGSVSQASAITTITKGAITGNRTDGYDVAVTAAGTSTTTVADGYVKGAQDITVNGEAKASGSSVALSKTAPIHLEAGKVAISTSDVSGDVAATGFEFAESATAYVIKPTVSGKDGSAKVSVSATQAGYIDAAYSEEVSLTLDDSNAQTRYLKAGTKLTTVSGTGTAKIVNDFATHKADGSAYIISLASDSPALNVSGTLAEGYYAGSDLAVSGTATVSGLTGQTTVAHGKVDVTNATASLSLSPAEGLVVHNATAGLAGYYKLTLSAQDLQVSRTITEGYIKDDEHDFVKTATEVTNTSSTDYYIAKYVNSNQIDGNYNAIPNGMGKPTSTNVEDWVAAGGEVKDLASDKIVIETANTYVDKNITVTLAADAAGKNVRGELYNLEQRLKGNKTTLVEIL